MMEATADYTTSKLYRESSLGQKGKLFNSATIVELGSWNGTKKKLLIENAHSSDETVDEILNIKKNGYQTNPMANIYNSTTQSKRKVSAIIMPFGVPSVFDLYAQEMSYAYREGWSIKVFLGSMLGLLYSLFGLSELALLGGIVFLGIFDAVISLIPGNVKSEIQKDHSLHSKLLALVTNILVIILVVIAHKALSLYFTPEGIMSTIGLNFHYAVVGWIYSIYLYRSIVYVANANNTKAPNFLKYLKTNK